MTGSLYAMAGRKAKLNSWAWIAPLACKARDELGLTGLLVEAGISTDRAAYNRVHRWLEGRPDCEGKQRSRALPDELGIKLREYLKERYSDHYTGAGRKGEKEALEALRKAWLDSQQKEGNLR